MSNPRIVIIAESYLPGIRGGGPVRSLQSLIHHCRNQYDFYLLCPDRDFGDTAPYPGVKTNTWLSQDGHKIMYVKRSNISLRALWRLLDSLHPDSLYINVLFSIRMGIIPMGLSRVLFRNTRTVVAPRGCLDPGALDIKHRKKNAFLFLLKLSRLPRHVVWHATNPAEAKYIQSLFGPVECLVAANLTIEPPDVSRDPVVKSSGHIKLLFLSRISKKKNLPFLLSLLPKLSGVIELTVAGPIEDPALWRKAERIIAAFPSNIVVSYIGMISHDDVPSVIHNHHVLVLPTLGENFGHVIAESLRAGRGVIVSDTTPWRNLADWGAGWDIALDDVESWCAVLQSVCNMDQNAFQIMCDQARMAYEGMYDDGAAVSASQRLFGNP